MGMVKGQRGRNSRITVTGVSISTSVNPAAFIFSRIARRLSTFSLHVSTSFAFAISDLLLALRLPDLGPHLHQRPDDDLQHRRERQPPPAPLGAVELLPEEHQGRRVEHGPLQGRSSSPNVSLPIRSSSGTSWHSRSEERRVGKECRSRWSP